MLHPHSPRASAAYHDLCRLLMDDAGSSIIGRPHTPSFHPEEDVRDLPALGVAAQSLHFLNFLIAEPIKAAALYRSGVLIQIPRPEA